MELIYTFQENIELEKETMIELMGALAEFVDNMETHIEKYPNYEYSIVMGDAQSGAYKASVIITRYEETEFTEENSSAHGIL